ncbi:MAG: hypothetical protein ACREJU_09225 [Nitrospiraceae bacterium]
MTDWACQQAEGIVDSFIANGSAGDLLHLQEAIAAALRRAYEQGKSASMRPDECS